MECGKSASAAGSPFMAQWSETFAWDSGVRARSIMASKNFLAEVGEREGWGLTRAGASEPAGETCGGAGRAWDMRCNLPPP